MLLDNFMVSLDIVEMYLGINRIKYELNYILIVSKITYIYVYISFKMLISELIILWSDLLYVPFIIL
jgi:hypothetical protein